MFSFHDVCSCEYSAHSECVSVIEKLLRELVPGKTFTCTYGVRRRVGTRKLIDHLANSLRIDEA